MTYKLTNSPLVQLRNLTTWKKVSHQQMTQGWEDRKLSKFIQYPTEYMTNVHEAATNQDLLVGTENIELVQSFVYLGMLQLTRTNCIADFRSNGLHLVDFIKFSNRIYHITG